MVVGVVYVVVYGRACRGSSSQFFPRHIRRRLLILNNIEVQILRFRIV